MGARVVKNRTRDIALVCTADNEILALRDRCPHRGGFPRDLPSASWFPPPHGCSARLETGIVEEPDEGAVQTTW